MTEPPNPTGPAALPQALHGLSKSLGRSTERGPTGARRQREAVWLAENRDGIAAWNDHVEAHGLQLTAFRQFLVVPRKHRASRQHGRLSVTTDAIR